MSQWLDKEWWSLRAKSKSTVEFSSGPLNSDTQIHSSDMSFPFSANSNCWWTELLNMLWRPWLSHSRNGLTNLPSLGTTPTLPASMGNSWPILVLKIIISFLSLSQHTLVAYIYYKANQRKANSECISVRVHSVLGARLSSPTPAPTLMSILGKKKRIDKYL